MRHALSYRISADLLSPAHHSNSCEMTFTSALDESLGSCVVANAISRCSEDASARCAVWTVCVASCIADEQVHDDIHAWLCTHALLPDPNPKP